MDEFTFAHMTDWIDRQYPAAPLDQYRAMVALLSAQYERDPELYDDAGWWRCHDDAGVYHERFQ